MRRKLISHSPEEVNLNNSDLLDKCLKKIFKEPIVKVQTIAYSFCLFFSDETSIKTNRFIAVLAICPERLNAI